MQILSGQLATTLKKAETQGRTCEKHGHYESEGIQVAGIEHWSPCPECDKDRELRAREYRERQEREWEMQARAARIRRTNIPPRYENAELDWFKTETSKQRQVLHLLEAYRDNFRRNLKRGTCLIFLGALGTGKTLLACAIANALDRAGYKVRYTTAVALIREIRDSWRKDSPVTETEILAKYRKLDLLILDEVGLQFGSDSELTQLTELIDNRYQDMKPMLVLSNCDLAGLTRYLGDRAIDRLRENGGQLITFDWGSWRRRPDKAGGDEE